MPKKTKQTKFIITIPKFEQFMQFCWDHADNEPCKTILIHALPDTELRALPDDTLENFGILEKKLKSLQERGYWAGRGGGGWKNAVETILQVLKMMLEE